MKTSSYQSENSNIVLLPGFNLQTFFEVPELIGVKLAGGKQVATAYMAVNLNLISGRHQEEGLDYQQEPDYIVSKPFLFGKFK